MLSTNSAGISNDGGRSRQLLIVLFVFGAVVFGMVLAGSLELTPPGDAQEPQRLAPTTVAAAGLPSFADLAEAVLPAVVAVQSATIETLEPGARRPAPFEFFFGPRRRGEQPQEYRHDGAGSGFVISPDGWVVTNFHVVEGATQVKVRLGERDYPAEVKGTDESTDLALLKIDAGGDLKYLALGDSDRLRVGEWVMAIGNPLALESSVTVGVVSAKGRQIGLIDRSFENFIQTDAAINRGNSGGPLVNIAGEVVGISTAMNFGAENIGFAVPVNTLQQILPQLRNEGRVKRGYLGVSIDNIDFDEMEAFGLTSTDGALVVEVTEATPAATAGLRPGDVILEVDERPVHRTRDLIDYIASQPPGTSVRLGLVRDGETIVKKVKLHDRDELGQVSATVAPSTPDESEWLGLQYQDLTPLLRGELSVPRDVSGVLVRDVEASSPLYEKGVRPGQLIVEVDGQLVSSVADFERAVGAVESGSLLRLYLFRFTPDGARNPFFAIVRKP